MIKDKQINLGNYSLFSTIKSILLIGLLIFIWNKGRLDKKELSTINLAINDSLIHYKNSLGEEYAKRMIIESRETKTFLMFQTQDTLLRELQSEVRGNKHLLKKRGSSTIIKTETKVDTTGVTNVVKDSITNTLIYASSISNPWYKISSIASKDSTSYNIQTFNKLKYTLGVEKTGFLGLGKGKPYAIANDENPYSSIKDMRSYQVTIPDKRIGISGYAGYGLTQYEQKVVIGPQVGVGATYTFLKF